MDQESKIGGTTDVGKTNTPLTKTRPENPKMLYEVGQRFVRNFPSKRKGKAQEREELISNTQRIRGLPPRIKLIVQARGFSPPEGSSLYEPHLPSRSIGGKGGFASYRMTMSTRNTFLE
ncbi:hypothetical protein Salat_0630800 [Sesamum alatum]|uniref:Uncharacterized protein n=1 Tax=Sesamum alatum TaxID=300844 RepID=A0AAE1YQW0_9LAMI|nr:hypothetical protein Salat_0630800 [Sesamum alatum]